MKTILCVDDSESHRFLLKEELSDEGYKVITASHIEEVLSKGTELNPDLVILELTQRNANDEFLAKLKIQYPNTPWIGYSTFAQCPEEFRKWVQFYSPKSCEVGGLKEMIKCL